MLILKIIIVCFLIYAAYSYGKYQGHLQGWGKGQSDYEKNLLNNSKYKKEL